MKFSHFIIGMSILFASFALAQPDVEVERQTFASLKNEDKLSTKDHLLIISPRFDDPGLISAESYLNERGKSYQSLIASEETLSEDKLIDENGKGLYEGIILTEGALSFNDNGNWVSAFSQEEWELLWQYEELFGVRQVALYTYPATEPENYGLKLQNPLDANKASYQLKFTEEGQEVLNVLSEDLTLNNAYAYQTRLEPSPEIETTPLLVDSQGNVFAVLSVQNGRERLAFTMAQSEFAGHTKQLLPTIFDWITNAQGLKSRGFLGIFSAELERFLLVNVLFVVAFLLLNWLRQRRKVKRHTGLQIMQTAD